LFLKSIHRFSRIGERLDREPFVDAARDLFGDARARPNGF